MTTTATTTSSAAPSPLVPAKSLPIFAEFFNPNRRVSKAAAVPDTYLLPAGLTRLDPAGARVLAAGELAAIAPPAKLLGPTAPSTMDLGGGAVVQSHHQHAAVPLAGAFAAAVRAVDLEVVLNPKDAPPFLPPMAGARAKYVPKLMGLAFDPSDLATLHVFFKPMVKPMDFAFYDLKGVSVRFTAWASAEGSDAPIAVGRATTSNAVVWCKAASLDARAARGTANRPFDARVDGGGPVAARRGSKRRRSGRAAAPPADRNGNNEDSDELAEKEQRPAVEDPEQWSDEDAA